ncbi:MAG: class I SAM-dependent methyltransferase [Gammaproteobacteria bacterium]|nr:class I SAM-dependent methyltransferase [Gammaproteobacteria bacterium]MDE0248906.1 class I SAM-dependent methyltransferase [Gammaproteobacteria bacterium]
MSADDDPLSGVRAGYDRWASVYDHDDNPLSALEEPHVRDALGDVRQLDVLDLGCGTGRHTAWLAAEGARVTAVDFSEEMLERARRKVPGTDVDFIVHDLNEPLPLEDASFHAVVSGLVLEHIRDPRAFFMDAHRVLKPGARAVVSAMHPAMFLRDVRARFTDPDSGKVVAPGSLPHQLGDFVMAALGAGFTLRGVGEYAPEASCIGFTTGCNR